jgi:3-(3-hydroxy-phenyl)propionate hydroxylase
MADIHLSDLLGPCFTALRFGGDASHDDAWQQVQHALREKGIPFEALSLITGDTPRGASRQLHDQTGRLHEMFAATPGTVYLVRPDGHVLARWRDGSAAATHRAVLASVTM